MEKLDIVDQNDDIIWVNTRHESYKNFTTNRIIAVVILNNEWKIALQQRSKTCSYMPLAWWLSAWGHVSSWETYLESAKRELKEEIWIECKLEFIDKIYWDRLELDKKYNSEQKSKNNHYFFESIYKWVYNWDFKLEDWEVEAVKFVSISEIEKMIRNWERLTNWCLEILSGYFWLKL